MKILFLSLSNISDINQHGLYNDLLREFAKNGHELTIVSPLERRNGKVTTLIKNENVQILRVKTGNIQKTNYIEKGISLLMLSRQLTRAIKKYCKDLSFDVILYATPPITIYGVIRKLKRMTGAKTFLMLKDIWPQEIVDLGILRKGGLLYHYFRHAEKSMYKISDWIGYTSPTNKKYLVEDGVDEAKLVPVHNSVDATYRYEYSFNREEIWGKHGIDPENTVFFYGGNLGLPQDVDFLIACLKTQIGQKGKYFVVCGQGTEYPKLEAFFAEHKPDNMKLFPYLPKQDYDALIYASDVGMVFLNHRFTVPNCPTRFYDCMEYSKPVLACTDLASDIREDIYEGGFGWWCESKDPMQFASIVDAAHQEGKVALQERGEKARAHLEKYYTVDKDYHIILSCIQK